MTNAFIAQFGAVYWTTPGGSYELDEAAREDLLANFENTGCTAAFRELHAAHVAAGGIARCTSFGWAA